MIFRNYSDLLLKKYLIIIINVENSCAAQYFCGNSDTLPFNKLNKEINTFVQQWCIDQKWQ